MYREKHPGTYGGERSQCGRYFLQTLDSCLWAVSVVGDEGCVLPRLLLQIIAANTRVLKSSGISQ